MADYQLTDTDSIIRSVDGASIPPDPANRDRQAFDAWVADGNTPDPLQIKIEMADTVFANDAWFTGLFTP